MRKRLASIHHKDKTDLRGRISGCCCSSGWLSTGAIQMPNYYANTTLRGVRHVNQETWREWSSVLWFVLRLFSPSLNFVRRRGVVGTEADAWSLAEDGNERIIVDEANWLINRGRYYGRDERLGRMKEGTPGRQKTMAGIMMNTRM